MPITVEPRSKADLIRARNGERENEIIAKLKELKAVADIPMAVGLCLLYVGSNVGEVAAQLAEINSRDTAAETRMKEMESLLNAMIAQQQASGILVPGLSAVPPKTK